MNPHFMAYVGVIYVLLIWGVGVVEIVFRLVLRHGVKLLQETMDEVDQVRPNARS